MPVKFAEGEKIIRSYDYGKVAKSAVLDATACSSNLTVTNRRIIHSRGTKGMGKSGLSVQEIPVGSAKYVNVAYGVVRYPIFLVFAFLFALFAIVLIAGLGEDGLSVVGAVPAVGAVICLIMYLARKDCVLNCSIATESIVSPVMAISTSSGNSHTRKLYRKAAVAASATTFNVTIKVNADVAKQMAEELGAVIIEAANKEIID